jgi:hypothetical protein
MLGELDKIFPCAALQITENTWLSEVLNGANEVVRLAYLGLSWLILAYFLSQNTIHSTSRALFILPAEHPQ